MNFKIKKLGIAISSYSETNTSDMRYDLLKESLATLSSTIEAYKGTLEIVVYLVIDGPVPDKHNEVISTLPKKFKLIRKKENGGISRVKNTGIRLLLEENVDVGILVDDDVWYGNGWIEAYSKVIEDLQIHHLAWCNDKHLFYGEKEERKKRNIVEFEEKGHQLLRHIAAAGIFLTFTPKLIEQIGYFKVFPGKIGGEHIQFTRRAWKKGLIKYPIDIAQSFRYIKHLGYLIDEGHITDDLILSSVSSETLLTEKINFGAPNKDLDGKPPCIE